MRKGVFTLIAVGVFLFILGTQAHANLVQLQPGPFDGMDVWYGNVYYKTGVHDEKLQVGGWGDEYHTLVRFNLGGMPQVADQVILWLWGFPRGDASTPTWIQWSPITSQWQSATVGWDTRPDSFVLGYTPPPSASGGWYGVIFTNQYNQWRRGNSSPLNYGLKLVPWSNNNNFDMFFSSRNPTYWARPLLYVYYTPQANDSVIKLTWPLYTPYASRVVKQEFGHNPWAGGTECPPGVPKIHNGTDYSASAGTVVYAAEDGIVKHVESHFPWAYHIVIEHISPTGAKYTTVSWHVNPSSGVVVGAFVPKGMQIATVADLTPYGHDTHFHFGIRKGVYDPIVSGVGALPQAICTDPNGTRYPGFPENFINPETSNLVLFQ